MANYQSEATHFLKALKAQRPGLEARQREGRAIWWDKTAIEPDEAKRQLDSRVPQKAYPYQTKT